MYLLWNKSIKNTTNKPYTLEYYVRYVGVYSNIGAQVYVTLQNALILETLHGRKEIYISQIHFSYK